MTSRSDASWPETNRLHCGRTLRSYTSRLFHFPSRQLVHSAEEVIFFVARLSYCLSVCLSRITQTDVHELRTLLNFLARKTPPKKPNRGEGIVSRKPRQKSAYDFLGLLCCFIVLLCICVVFCLYVIYFPTVMARYSLFMLKVPLNPNQANKQTLEEWDV